MTKRATHWTERSKDDFRYSVAFDFMCHVEDRLKSLDWSQDRLAEEIGVSKGRISQLLNNPGNLTLKTMVSIVRSLSMKFSIVSYDDADSINVNGPIASNVFLSCWAELNKPCNLWEVEDVVGSHKMNVFDSKIHKHTWHDKIKMSKQECVIIEFPKKTDNCLSDTSHWKKPEDADTQTPYKMSI